jgi:hypothetical protein
MRLQEKAWLPVMTAALALLGSCTLSSQHPLSDEKTSKLDQRLIGDWILDNTDNEIWRVTRKPGTKNSLELTILNAASGRIQQGPYTVFTTVVGKDRYLSVEESDEQSGGKRYEVSRYAWVDGDTIQPFAADTARIARAISAGELQGTVEKKRGLPGSMRIEDAVVTAAPEAVARFLEKHGREVFPAPKDKDSAVRFMRRK